MGLLSNIASKAAKSALPKILIGGKKEDRKAVQSFVNTGQADPVFTKFGDHFEQSVKITAGIATAAIGGGLLDKIGKPYPMPGGNTGIAGGGLLLKSDTKSPVGLLETITKGIGKVDAFSKTQLGSQLIGTLGKVVTNLATPTPRQPSTVAQQAALQQGTQQDTPQTVGQAAVFDGKGVRVILGPDQGDTWWDKNKSWALPVFLAVPGFFVLLFMLFGGRRRR